MDTIKISELDSYVTPQNSDLLAVVDTDNEETKKMTLQNFINMIYPVGSIYISTSSANPSTLFGGTWVAFATGRTLVGVGSYTDGNGTTLDYSTVEYSSGEYLHTLSTNEIPSHRHEGINWYGNNAEPISLNTGAYSGYAIPYSAGTNETTKDNMFTQYAGGGAGHNTCQPSITVYMWKRTA